MNKLCLHCMRQFEAANQRTLYCSISCRGKAAQMRVRKRQKSGVPAKAKSPKWYASVLASKDRVVKATLSQIIRDRDPRVSFNISIDDFERLIFSPCHYCGAPPSTPTKSGKLMRNGLDRLDTSIGYNVSNCVTSCWLCNRMKWHLSPEAFLRHVRQIVLHNDTTRAYR